MNMSDNDYYTPRERSSRGVYKNHSVRPSVCADSCQAHNFFFV